MNEDTPRITAAYLETFSNRAVRIVGKVTKLLGEQAVIDAGGQITLSLNRVSDFFSPVWREEWLTYHQDAHLAVDHAVEVIGRVQSDLSVKVFSATDLGTGVGEYLSGTPLDCD